MRHISQHRRTAAVAVAACLLAACLAGCGFIRKVTRELRGGVAITAAGGKTIWQQFGRRVYADRGEGLADIVLTSESLSEDPNVGEVSQTLLIRMQWRHSPGDTSMDAASTNSLVRYRIRTARGWREYRGAGAVKATHGLGGSLNVRLTNATLRPVAFGGDLPDVYGAATFAGRFRASRNEQAVAEALAALRGRPAASASASP